MNRSGTPQRRTTSAKSEVNNKRFPRRLLRDSKEGYKTIVAFFYALIADCLGIYWMIQQPSSSFPLQYPVAMALAIHGRIVASYLVHEATHDSIFVEKRFNRWMGVACVWLAGCPYCNFDHIRKMHIAHHKDRTDLVEFDYRRFVQEGGVVVKTICCSLEFCFVPVIETMMHVRQAFGPIAMGVFFPKRNHFFTPQRINSACLGTPIQLAFYALLWHHDAFWMQIVSGAIVLHLLALGDAFHHTYEAVFPQDYTPGPGNRTAQFEESNTYSNLISTRYPSLNVLNLNFAYHNAHHKRPMVPWYKLPDYHDQLYGTHDSSSQHNKVASPNIEGIECPQVLPVADVLSSWYRNRLRRVVEEDYGVVYPAGTPNRARDFVGTLGASFLTV